MRETIDTTYADLRPSDLVIDKSGQAWPIEGLSSDRDYGVLFWLCDPVTKIQLHSMTKTATDAVKVSRLPTQADEAAKLEAEFPGNNDDYYVDAEKPATADNFATMAEAVAAVEEIGGIVEAEVTAEEVDAAAAATDDSPLTLPPFADMTPLEQRSHLYLLHGVYGHDLVSKQELSALHDEAHATPPQSRFVPHSHG